MLPHISLTHLKYFCDAAGSGSVSEAAKKNYVSQSAISQGIQKLEIALGITLISHQRQRFQLTDEGQLVFEESEKIFRTVNDLYERIGEQQGELQGEVRFVCTNAIAQFFLPDGYLKMKRAHPKVHLQFHRGGMEFIRNSLKQQSNHFALVLNSPDFAEHKKIVVSKGSFKLYHSKRMCKPNLENGILIDHTYNPEVISLRKAYNKKERKELQIQEELSGWGMVASFVSKGIGVGLLPQFIGEGLGLKEHMQPYASLPYEICAVLPRKSLLNRCSTAFLDLLKEK